MRALPKFARTLLCLAAHASAAAASGAGSAPPFSGLYGGTAGAGGTLGWDRLALGANPAAPGAPGTRASLAGYSPFGLEGLRALELGAARDAPRWGAAVVYQHWADAGRAISADAEAQAAVRVGNARAGLSLATSFPGSSAAPEAYGARAMTWGLGGLWRGRFGGLPLELGSGAMARGGTGGARLLGFGADAGGRWPLGRHPLSGLGLRAGGEAFFEEGAWETRFGLLARLHPALSLHGGWAPRRRTAALGVRFGAGPWEGFSAMRRHAALGGTAIQGLRWSRPDRGGQAKREHAAAEEEP